MPSVSVIVPVYNSEKYLEQCVDSLLTQTARDIEIILVNDGSTDSSLEICQRYARADSRIVVINKENGGAGPARATGVAAASAPFLAFIDSDDVALPQMCERLLAVQAETGADVVECAYNVMAPSGKLTIHRFLPKDTVLLRDDFRREVVGGTIIGGTEAVLLWNKLYRREMFISSVKEEGKNVLEDYLINMQYYLYVDRYAYIAEPLVNYRVVPGSLSRRFDPKLFDSLMWVVELKLRYMKNYGMSDEEHLRIHSEWLVRYIENYLVSGIRCKGGSSIVDEILRDERLKAAALPDDGIFASMIKRDDVRGVVRYLQSRARKQALRSALHRLKEFVFRK